MCAKQTVVDIAIKKRLVKTSLLYVSAPKQGRFIIINKKEPLCEYKLSSNVLG